MKFHGLTAMLLLGLLCVAATAQNRSMPNAYEASCDECSLLPGLRCLLASHTAPIQNCGCCTQKCCQKSCCQKAPLQKSCCQKAPLHKGHVQKGGCLQKPCCIQKPCCAPKCKPVQKGCCQKPIVHKGHVQKGHVQKGGCCQKSHGKGGCCLLGGGALLSKLFGHRCCSSGCCGGNSYAPGDNQAIDGDIPQPNVNGNDPFGDDPIMRPTTYANRRSVLYSR